MFDLKEGSNGFLDKHFAMRTAFSQPFQAPWQAVFLLHTRQSCIRGKVFFVSKFMGTEV